MDVRRKIGSKRCKNRYGISDVAFSTLGRGERPEEDKQGRDRVYEKYVPIR